MTPISLSTPYLLFIGDVAEPIAAKTSNGIARWRPDWCIGQYRYPGCPVDLGLADLSLQEAWDRGARTLVLGVANRGGIMAPQWRKTLAEALEIGYDLASGLHARLNDDPQLSARAKELGRRLIDVRYLTFDCPVATGDPRSGRRLLTVGTDCSVGKMFTTLAIHREMVARKVAADFVATGQTGIFISGCGVSIDALISDFISGAVEVIAPAHPDPEHWYLIEGQGSLFHPSYAGVTLGLVHGAQAEALVLCHDLSREHLRHLPRFPQPTLEAAIARYEEAARLTAPASRVVGLSVNTSSLEETAAKAYLREVEDRLQLPATDAYRFGAAPLVDAVL
ncbi:MAG TPA: N-acetyltransferase DgcN [Chthoniobacteraceae bacterium]|nr:N-acetyltransferase DgcN [Chthoniobacteraceae bacterium]